MSIAVPPPRFSLRVPSEEFSSLGESCPPEASGAAARPDPQSISEALLATLHALGVRRGFGVTGGAVATLCDALGRSALRFVHCRHETGAAFAAVEAYFASGSPSLVFTTSGPGLTNALTGVAAARWEGAKLVLVSGSTPTALRGRWACQETSGYTMPLGGLFTAGPLFDYAVMMEHPAEFAEVASRLASGLSRPGGFVAHVSIPTSLQGERVTAPTRRSLLSTPPSCAADALDEYARMLADEPFVIWVGFGARGASEEIRALVERTGAPVMCSPRAKGVFPERHPNFLGVTGLGGHARPEEYMRAHRPAHVLVLGTRLGEPTSYWQRDYVPERAFIHVDIDPEVPGTSYPDATTYAVHAEVKSFLRGLLAAWPRSAPSPRKDASGAADPPEREAPRSFLCLRPTAVPARREEGPVRPAALMDAVQRLVVDSSDAVVMTESGNAFAWGNHLLRFDEPGRYRVSVGFGSMGHVASGVVGAALARGGKAVALVGDGSMLMNNEVSTAVQYGARAVWVVLNDASYGMVEHGMRALGFAPTDTTIPRVDFVAVAQAMGANGARVRHEGELDAALAAAMEAEGPFVVDVRVDPSEPGPWMKRIQGLILQGARGDGSEP